MNINNVPNYSRETVGLRQSVQIRDQQFRLIYGYPMIFADIIGQQEVRMNFRNFLAISFLREIFVSNSLNIIQMASRIPAANETRNSVAQLIGNAFLGAGGGSGIDTGAAINASRQTSDVNTYQLQQKVEVKTNEILKRLLSDPRTRKLSPQIEIITLSNLIDVPVIVGTRDFSLPTYPLIFLLLIAVVTRTPLNKMSNIDRIIRVLQGVKEDEWMGILRNVTSTEDRVNAFAKWVTDYYPNVGNQSQTRNWTRWLANRLGVIRNDEDPIQQRDLAPRREYELAERNEIFNVLKLIKNSLNDLQFGFRTALHPDLLRRYIGLNISNNTMETTVMKLSSNQQQIFMSMHDKFMELVAMPGSLLLSSVFNTLYPMWLDHNNEVISKNLNFLELKETHFDAGLNSKIQKLIFDTLASEIANSMMQYSAVESQERMNLLKKMCESLSTVNSLFEDEIKRFHSSTSSVITSVHFTEHNMNTFASNIHRFASSFLSHNKRFENAFSQLVNNGNGLLKTVQTQLYASIDDFIRSVTATPYEGSALSYNLGVNHNQVMRTYIPQIKDTLFTIFYFFFLYRLQTAVCNYVDVLDVEIESKVHDVFDFPNYTLVITTDILRAVYTAYIASNMRNLISGNMRDVGRITQNHIKGMVDMMCNRLLIPSIIVYDEKTREIFYRFMFMSNTERMTDVSLASFIRANSNTTIR